MQEHERSLAERKEALEAELLELIRGEWDTSPDVAELNDAVLASDFNATRSLLDRIPLNQKKHDLILGKIKELEEWPQN